MHEHHDCNVKRKISITTASGYRCHRCHVNTVTYDKSVPEKCLNCGTPDPKLSWQDVIQNDTTVTTVKL